MFWESVAMGSISTGRNSKVKIGCLSVFKGLHLRELMGLCQAHWELALGRVGLQLCYHALTQDYQQAITSDVPGLHVLSTDVQAESQLFIDLCRWRQKGTVSTSGQLSWETLWSHNCWPQQLCTDTPDTSYGILGCRDKRRLLQVNQRQRTAG